jgi:hypothetical protein
MMDLNMTRKLAMQVGTFMDKVYAKPTGELGELLDCSRMPGLTWKQKLAYLAFKMYNPNSLVETPVTHFFSKGEYVRTMFIPRGRLFIGREHILGHIVRLVSGKAFLIEEAGKMLKEAPAEIMTRPGYQTVAYTITDVVAQTVHPNPLELRDVQVLEDLIFGPAELVLEEGRLLAELLGLKELECQVQ